jgi:hypothetical protein
MAGVVKKSCFGQQRLPAAWIAGVNKAGCTKQNHSRIVRTLLDLSGEKCRKRTGNLAVMAIYINMVRATCVFSIVWIVDSSPLPPLEVGAGSSQLLWVEARTA